jgi:hypothetical protein
MTSPVKKVCAKILLMIGKLVTAILVLTSGGLTAAAGATYGDAAAEAAYFGAFRVVRVTPGAVTKPEVTLPAGYSRVAGAQYDVASRAEYYTFVSGPRSAGIEVEIHWPNTPIKAVIWHKTRLPLTGTDDRVTFRLPITAESPTALRDTLEIWSYPGTTPGAQLRVEHNDPDRAVSWWAERPWKQGETRSVLHQIYAAERILADSGLAAEAAARGHFFAVQGFETANTLHLDNPPHWHISYIPGSTWSASPVYVPHLWIDAEGRNFYNGMDVTGKGRSRFYAGDPAVIRRPDDSPVVTLTIRYDGGLDIEPPGGPVYSIVGDDLTERVGILKDGMLWTWISVYDDTDSGRLEIHEPGGRVSTYGYDPLTGLPQAPVFVRADR